jgi:4-nitrophenyl phosphatase
VNGVPAERLGRIAACVLDMDGVLYRGRTPIPGAAEALAALRRRGPVLMLTNNSTRQRRPLADRLAGMGFAVAPDDIVIVNEVAVAWLAARHPGRRLLVLGEEHLCDDLRAAGFPVVEDWRQAEVVACCLGISHRLLGSALNALRAGAAFVATNPDLVVDGDDGLDLEAGAYVRLLADLCGHEPAVIGKPEAPCFAHILVRLGIADPGRVAMVGDNPDTDVAGARRNGLFAVQVLSGVAATGSREADLVVPDLGAFAERMSA